MDEKPPAPNNHTPRPLPGAAARLAGALRLLGGTAVLTGLALLFAGPEALREVAQICRSLLSV